MRKLRNDMTHEYPAKTLAGLQKLIKYSDSLLDLWQQIKERGVAK